MQSTKLFNDKLARIFEASGAKGDSALANILKIKPPSVAAARKRQQIPSGWVEQIAEQFNVSADWLFFGTGPMRSGETPQSAQIPTDITMVPMVEARLSAGHGSFETSDEVHGHYAFRTEFLRRKGQASKMVLMRVTGESMQPEIRHGDAVLVDQSQTAPRPGITYAVGVEDMVYLKIIDAQPGKLVLRSFNPAYAPIDVPMDEDMVDSVRIIGRVVWLGREF